MSSKETLMSSDPVSFPIEEIDVIYIQYSLRIPQIIMMNNE